MRNVTSIHTLTNNPHWSVVLNIFVDHYKTHSGGDDCGLLDAIRTLVFREIPLVHQETGKELSYVNLERLLISELLDHVVPSTDGLPAPTVRDIITANIRRSFNNSQLQNIWRWDQKVQNRKAAEALGIRRDMLASDIENLGGLDALLEIARRSFESYIEDMTVYSLFVLDCTDGFMRFDGDNGFPSSDIKYLIEEQSRTLRRPFGVDTELLIQCDKVDTSYMYEPDESPTLDVWTVGVAWVDANEDWLGTSRYIVFCPISGNIPSNDRFKEAFEFAEADDYDWYFSAEALCESYGTPLLFQHGALALLSDCELAADRRGQRFGARFVALSLNALKEQFSEIRGMAWNPTPKQFFRGADDELLPHGLHEELRIDQFMLRRYCLKHENVVSDALSDDTAEGTSFMFSVHAGPDIYEIFDVSKSDIAVEQPTRH